MITTHVLDLSSGAPASGIRVTLLQVDGSHRTDVGTATTNADGRVREFTSATALRAGTFELQFDTGEYFRGRGVQSFHPRVTVTFQVADPAQHYHVPLLVSPFGYTTYRGS